MEALLRNGNKIRGRLAEILVKKGRATKIVKRRTKAEIEKDNVTHEPKIATKKQVKPVK